MPPRSAPCSMKAADRYFRYVCWSEVDQLYIGYCPDLFSGGICHGHEQVAVFAELCEIIDDDCASLVAGGEALPEANTAPPFRHEYTEEEISEILSARTGAAA